MSKKLKIAGITLTSVILVLFSSITVHATTGACSGHDGVNCLAGPGSGGSVICNDAWTESSVLYSDMRDVCMEDFHPFIDVDGMHPNEEAILTMYEKAIIIGYDDFTFRPDAQINRVEFLKILIEGAGISPDESVYNNCFPDVGSDWYAKYVCYAKEQGWVQGYEDNTFKPVNNVNKVEAIKMLVETQGFSVDENLTTAPFNDVSLDDWFVGYVDVAKDKGLLEETGTTLNPAVDMTRASITEMTYRALMVKENALNSFAEYIGGNISSETVSGNIIQTHYREWTINEIQVADSSNDFLLYSENNKFVGVHLTNKNTTDITKEFNNVNTWIKDAAGNEYPWEFSIVFEPNLQGGILNPDETRSGWATFEVPAELTEAELVFVSTDDEGDVLRIKTAIEIPEVGINEPTGGEEVTQLATMSISAYWRSWDADAEDDGFELGTHFKSDDGESVYPELKDWTVEVKLYEAEMDYSKYGDFGTHKIGNALHSLSYSLDEVKYESYINLPYVRVAVEDVPQLTEDKQYIWIDATFSSESQGTFSAYNDYISFYLDS